MWFIVLAISVVLVIVITLIYIKYQPTNFVLFLSSMVTAMATSVIAASTIYQVKLNRSMLEEMRMSRQQEHQPFIDVRFEVGDDNDVYMLTHNYGNGIAKLLKITYFYRSSEDFITEESFSHRVLGPGEGARQKIALRRDMIMGEDLVKVFLSYSTLDDEERSDVFHKSLLRPSGPLEVISGFVKEE